MACAYHYLVVQQVRVEALQLHYEENVWECWKASFPVQRLEPKHAGFLGPDRTTWLRHNALPYKHDSGLGRDVSAALADEGFVLKNGTMEHKQALTRSECFPQLGQIQALWS